MTDATLSQFAAATASVRAVTFKAWCGNRPMRGLEGALEFADALNGCLSANSVPHKSVLTILREDAGRREKELRFYQIKQSTKRGTWRDAYDGGRKVFVGNLEPHLLHALAVREFEPVEAFDAFRDDPVGIDRSLVVVK